MRSKWLLNLIRLNLVIHCGLIKFILIILNFWLFYIISTILIINMARIALILLLPFIIDLCLVK